MSRLPVLDRAFSNACDHQSTVDRSAPPANQQSIGNLDP